jgi:hypothetical protein
MQSGRSSFAARKFSCDTLAGSNASASLYSLLETAKANGIKPCACLRSVIIAMPQATSVAETKVKL